MSYNNPEELLRITDYFQGRSRSRSASWHSGWAASFRTVAQWLDLFPDHDEPLPQTDHCAGGELWRRSRTDSGTSPCVPHGVAAVCCGVRRATSRNPRPLARPHQHDGAAYRLSGRTMQFDGGQPGGDHGGRAARRRPIELRNVQPDLFPDATVSLGTLVSQLNWDDWLSCINSDELERHLRESAGNWSIYVEAAMLRMQMAFRDRLLRGWI
jgi:N-acetylgalactosamine kinase